MKKSMTFYKRVKGALPKSYTNHIKQSMVYAGIETMFDEWIGFFFLYSIASGLTGLIILMLVFNIYDWLILTSVVFGVFAGFQIISEVLLLLSKRSRTVFIETILPDVLALIASNIKSGMTIDQALLLSTRDEFGNFKKDIIKASKETLAGKTLGEALMGLSVGIDSKSFKKTVELIVEGINGGGEISVLLENIANDVRSRQVLKKEIRASIVMYTLILILASGFGAPLLFGVSLYEVETITSLSNLVPDVDVPGSSFLQFSPGGIDIDFLRIISIVSIAINAIFGALMYGLLETGSRRDGIRMIPFLLILSLSIFFAANYLVGSILSGISF